jgi:hypothetical protein
MEPQKILATPEQTKKLFQLKASLDYVWAKRGLLGHSEWTQIEDFATRIDRILNPDNIDELIEGATKLIDWLISIQPVSYGDARVNLGAA